MIKQKKPFKETVVITDEEGKEISQEDLALLGNALVRIRITPEEEKAKEKIYETKATTASEFLGEYNNLKREYDNEKRILRRHHGGSWVTVSSMIEMGERFENRKKELEARYFKN